MARKTETKTPTTKRNSQLPIDWANIKLSQEDIPIIQELASDPLQCLGELVKLCDNGYSISIKRRDDNNTVQVSIIGANSRDLSRNVGLSGFAPSVWEAVASVLFKYHDIAGTVLEDHLSSGSSVYG